MTTDINDILCKHFNLSGNKEVYVSDVIYACILYCGIIIAGFTILFGGWETIHMIIDPAYFELVSAAPVDSWFDAYQLLSIAITLTAALISAAWCAVIVLEYIVILLDVKVATCKLKIKEK